MGYNQLEYERGMSRADFPSVVCVFRLEDFRLEESSVPTFRAVVADGPYDRTSQPSFGL